MCMPEWCVHVLYRLDHDVTFPQPSISPYLKPTLGKQLTAATHWIFSTL